MPDLSGKRILLTGATRGLGERVCFSLWEAGASVVAVARDEEALYELGVRMGSPRNPSQRFLSIPCDLAMEAGNLAAVASKTLSIDGGLHGLVNNAAVLGPSGPAWENAGQEWEKTFAVNLFAPVALCRRLLPLVSRSGGGSIVNVSGGGATSPRPNYSAYAASKAALVRFSETLAIEAAPLGVTVNCVAPGAMPTDMLKEVLAAGKSAGEREALLAERVFATGGGDTVDCAAALVVFLLSPEARGINGKIISAVWDDWADLPNHVDALGASDVYTLRRITARDRGFSWGDK